MLAAIKLGVVVIPATTLLTPDELRDRLDRGRAKAVVASQDQVAKFAGLGGDDLAAHRGRRVRRRMRAGCPYEETAGISGDLQAGWADQRRRSDAALFHLRHHGEAEAGAAQPAQLSRRRAVDDVLAGAAARRHPSEHLLAGLGQACLELFVRALECRRHRVRGQSAALRCQGLLATIARCGVTTLCAPPTVWRLFIQEKLADFKVSLREVCGAGEPLNPEVIDQVRTAWGLTIRDGYGQTETTALAGNSPGQKVKVGSMGRPLPGYRVQITDARRPRHQGRRGQPAARRRPSGGADAGLSGR